jgi:hypothetical protein
MIDTIKLYLPHEHLPRESLYTIPPLLTNTKITTDLQTGSDTFSGQLKNLNIRLNQQIIFISGSITKFVSGTNWQLLPHEEIQQAFESLSDILHLPIQQAIITRLDMGVNIFMNNHESLYYETLDYCPRYVRLPMPNGVYFTQNQKQLLFYGKEKEQKEKGILIPEFYKGRNTLRYEMRWRKGLPKQLNIKRLNVETLCQKKMYLNLINRMQQEYFKIKKQKITTLPLDCMQKPKLITDYFFLKGIEAEFGSMNKAIAFINKAKQSGMFDNKMQPARLKEKIKSAYKNSALTSNPDFMLELDNKLKEALAI